MAMWINWYPVFETGVNYAYTYKNTLNKPMIRVESEKLKNIFKCKEVIGEITLQVISNQTYYIKYDNNFLKTDYPQRLYLILIYDKTQCKTIKFKRGNLYIKINTEKGECESDDYTTISDELELINDVTSYGYANTDIGIKLPMSQFTLTEEFGIEYNLDPYVWTTETGESWTPSQLKFSSMVNYSNILTEDNSDSGDSTLLPETSNAAGAEHFLQDDDDYCYIEDNEGNIVYNKLLNTIARKTKINNGYRFNGDQSLELISFNNNIRSNYDKQSGQYLFNDDKKQKYGDKEDKNKINLEQNIPYFGGNPAVYPVLVEETYSAGTAFSGVLQKRGNKIIYNSKTYNINENDEVILYQRIGSLEMKNEPENEPNFSYEHTSSLGTYYYQIYNMNLKFETTSKTYRLKTNSDFDFDFNQAHNPNIWTETTNLFYKKIISTSEEECIWEFKNSFNSQTTQNASIWWGLVGENGSYFQVNYTGLIDSFIIPTWSLETPMKFEGFLQQGYLSNPYMKNWEVWGLFSFPYMRGIYTQTPVRTNFNWTYNANENQASRYTAHISPTEDELYNNDWEEYLSSFSKKLSIFTNTVVTDYVSLGGDGSWLVNRYYDGKDDLNQFDADEKDLSPIGWKINSGSYFSNYSSSHSEQYNEYSTTKTFHWCFLPNELPAYAIVIWKNGKLLENS